MQILQQAVWRLFLQLQGSHKNGAEAEVEVEAKVEAGKALRSSRDLVNYRTEDLAVCAMRMDYIMVNYISNVELDSSFEPTSPLNHHHY